jgi:hypothetical protein
MKIPALLSFAMLATAFTVVSAEKETRVFEMRTYHAAPGKLDALNARFREHTTKLFEKHGMTNIGYWMPVENNDNLLIYARVSEPRCGEGLGKRYGGMQIAEGCQGQRGGRCLWTRWIRSL